MKKIINNLEIELAEYEWKDGKGKKFIKYIGFYTHPKDNLFSKRIVISPKDFFNSILNSELFEIQKITLHKNFPEWMNEIVGIKPINDNAYSIIEQIAQKYNNTHKHIKKYI